MKESLGVVLLGMCCLEWSWDTERLPELHDHVADRGEPVVHAHDLAAVGVGEDQ